MSTGKKIMLFILCIALITVGVISSIYVPRRMTYNDLKNKYSKSTTPKAYIIPTEKSTKANSAKNRSEIKTSIYGLKFSTPWGNPTEIKTVDTLTSYKYSNNMLLTILDERTDLTLTETLRTLDPKALKNARDFFDKNILISKYKFYNALLNISPKEITTSLTKKQLESKDSLLCLKTLIMTKDTENIFKFNTNNLNIFQFGTTKPNAALVRLNVFGEDNISYTIGLKGNNLTQDDIEKVITSLELTTE